MRSTECSSSYVYYGTTPIVSIFHMYYLLKSYTKLFFTSVVRGPTSQLPPKRRLSDPLGLCTFTAVSKEFSTNKEIAIVEMHRMDIFAVTLWKFSFLFVNFYRASAH